MRCWASGKTAKARVWCRFIKKAINTTADRLAESPNNPDGTPRTDSNNPDETLRNRPLKGLENLRDFVAKGDNKWADGRIYDPKNGSDYACEMKLVDENTLEVRGFIGVSLFGRTDVWKRQIKKA
jgi:uncharacterized protein (DUF2147 family)